LWPKESICFMRHIRQAALVAAGFLLLFAPPAQAQHVPGAPVTDWERARRDYTVAVMRDYNAVMSDWREVLSNGDGSRAADLYANGAILMIPGEEPVQGRDSIRAWLGRAALDIVDIRLALSDFVASDQLAFATGPMIYTFRESGSVTQRTISGQHVTILVRENRRWRIRSQVLRYDKQPAAGGVTSSNH
jgi:ketosteroid isomerase-like protein